MRLTRAVAPLAPDNAHRTARLGEAAAAGARRTAFARLPTRSPQRVTRGPGGRTLVRHRRAQPGRSAGPRAVPAPARMPGSSAIAGTWPRICAMARRRASRQCRSGRRPAACQLLVDRTL